MKVRRINRTIRVEISVLDARDTHSASQVIEKLRTDLDSAGLSWVLADFAGFDSVSYPDFESDAMIYEFYIPERTLIFKCFDDVLSTRSTILHRKF
jgi:hypothetical protein